MSSTHQNSAGLEGQAFHVQPEVLAIDLGARRDPNPSVSPRDPWQAAFALPPQSGRLRVTPPDRQVAFHRQFLPRPRR